jgi:hypothetical protein
MADQPFDGFTDTTEVQDADVLLGQRGAGGVNYTGSQFFAVSSLGYYHAKPKNTAVGGYNLVLESTQGGYGSGLSFQSKLWGGGVLTEMARITADGENAWDTTLANQDAGLRFYTARDGVSEERVRINNLGNIRPTADNSQSIGEAPFRWSVIYAGTGTINTSDEREKAWRGALNEAELRAASRIASEIGVYQWNEAVEKKGPEKARLHVGVRAQAVWAIMAEEGLADPIGEDGKPGLAPYAFLCWDEWDEQRESVFENIQIPAILDDEGNETDLPRTEQRATGETRVVMADGNRFGVRVDQLALFIAAAQEQRLAALENLVEIE